MAAVEGQGQPATGLHRAAAPIAVSERRLVSVLFADLVGFTSLAADQDPEAVRELLGQYFEVARERIERYGGAIEKFIGDAVMAVWGTPVAHEDDAERAVRAALELVDAVSELQLPAGLAAPAAGAPQPGLPTSDPTRGVRLRAAVLSGEAAVTLGAVGQSMVAGDLVNTASRLQSAAEPGQVLVGEATFHAARSAIVFEPAGERSLRGKAVPVSAWQAVRVVAGRQGAGRTERLEPPFVGRDNELRLLKELLHSTARESRLRLVSVTGVGGIGKTRLAWELEKYIDGLVEVIYWHQGRSPAYGEGVTFWALADMVRQRARIADTDGTEESREKLRATLQDHIPDPEERAWIEPRLAVLLGLDPTPPGEREELFAAWRRFFERISERGSVVLVFEELQWADEGLLAFIESLVEWSRGRPILVLTLARPELLERRSTWGAAQRSFLSMHLEPLAPEAMELLLVGLAPGMPQKLIRLIASRAEGIPLYAVEMVRMLVDQGRLTEREGRYHLVGELADVRELTVPESLHALIAARLDGFQPEERELIQHAAVLGLSFTLNSLVNLSGESPAAVEATLRTLTRKELVVLDSDPRSPERGQYRFVQGLIREVAYARLGRRERQSRHVAAARFFEAVGDQGLAGVVASHYVQAHRAAQDASAAEELAGHAVSALVLAADRATDLYNHRQALGFLQDAIEIEANQERRTALRERAADAAFNADEGAIASRLYEGLAASHREHGDAAGLARALTRSGTILLWSKEGPRAAVRHLELAREELASLEGKPEFVALEAELARAYLMDGDFVRAAETIDRVLPIAERLELLTTIAELLASKGWATAELGRSREANALLRGTLPFAEAHGFPNAFFRATMNLSSQGVLGDPREAMEVARYALTSALRFGYHTWAVYLASNLTYAALLAGDWDLVTQTARDLGRDDLEPTEALNLYGPDIVVTAHREGAAPASIRLEQLRGLENSPSHQDRAFYGEVTARVALADRRFDAAYEWGRTATEQDVGFLPTIGTLIAARASLWRRDASGAREALRLLHDLRHKTSAVRAHRRGIEAGIAALEGDGDAARAAYEEAFRLLKAINMDFDLAFVLVERASFVTYTRDSERDQAVEEARVALLALGATAWLSWLGEPQPPATLAIGALESNAADATPQASAPDADPALRYST